MTLSTPAMARALGHLASWLRLPAGKCTERLQTSRQCPAVRIVIPRLTGVNGTTILVVVPSRHRLSRSHQATQLPTPAPDPADGPSCQLADYLPSIVVEAINNAGIMRDLYPWQVHMSGSICVDSVLLLSSPWMVRLPSCWAAVQAAEALPNIKRRLPRTDTAHQVPIF